METTADINTAIARFVRTFIKKERRERLDFELTTPRRRYAGLSRFCHHSGELLDPRKIVLSGEDLDHRAEFCRFVAGHDGICLVLSPELYPEQALLPLAEAVEIAAMSTDAALILGDGFAIVFGEAELSDREKYLLQE